ncbi:hypothetical protein [Actinoplanes friuliensis]|jgi:hypothetical protein|uniref:Uncharacterized protein n=1 Tax=Actinoplanes friuliensis DSM 7358 TaxID=1246995 RepID=U5W4X8_9ACTN|nr:hypothetical protein [Actinoplanes friuliensis]AGZ44268.1 hypothetical protein AFR_30040 [Actinoplanes friuliensis DSM 7358]
MLVPRTDHLPARPSWDCLVCECSWPCVNAKEDLASQYARFPAGLAIYMASVMYDAVEDLTATGEPSPADLYERFLAWVG